MYLRILEYNSVTAYPGGIRRGFRAARFLEVWVRILWRVWMSVSCERRGCCDRPITRPNKPYGEWSVTGTLETLRVRRPRPTRVD
jgi:hypothetical protein